VVASGVRGLTVAASNHRRFIGSLPVAGSWAIPVSMPETGFRESITLGSSGEVRGTFPGVLTRLPCGILHSDFGEFTSVLKKWAPS